MSDPSGMISFSSMMQPGQKVRVLTGPFAGRIGELVRADDKNRVHILLDVMGAQLMVRANKQALAPVA